MKALQIERSLARFAAARATSGFHPAAGGRVGLVRLVNVDPPALPDSGWRRLRPRLAGICGSDLATVDGRSSRWFEPIVSFPFVPGHEVVADDEDGNRVVIEPVLACQARGIEPPCPPCAAGQANHCHNLTGGHVSPGLQTGYCHDTGGGWSAELVAHTSQIHPVPDALSDQEAVMVEPAACGVHAALAAPPGDDDGVVAVIGTGTLGLCVLAGLSRFRPDLPNVVAAAKHPQQRRLARELGASVVVEPGELRRGVRRLTGSWLLAGGQLSGGASVTYDCVGSAASLEEALAVTAPGGTIVLAGMAGRMSVDLSPLWQREIHLVGAYTYGPEPLAGGRRSFQLAFELVSDAGMGRLVSAAYPLEQYADALEHAACAGRRGAVKVVFDLRRAWKR